MAELTREDLRALLLETMRSGEVLDILNKAHIAALKSDEGQNVLIEAMAWKLEMTAGWNCRTPESRREIKDDQDFSHKTRIWSESEEGKLTISAVKNLAKLIGTPEGDEKLATLNSLAVTLNGTEKWVKSRVARAIVIGLIVIAIYGASSVEGVRDVAKGLIRVLQ